MTVQPLKGYVNRSIKAAGRWNVAQTKKHVVYTNCSAPFSACTYVVARRTRVDTWCLPNKPKSRWLPVPKPPFAFPRRAPPLRTLHSCFFSIMNCNLLLHFCINSVFMVVSLFALLPLIFIMWWLMNYL